MLNYKFCVNCYSRKYILNNTLEYRNDLGERSNFSLQ